MTNRETLIQLYKEMAEHTLPECKSTCRAPMSCCDALYCDITIDHARERWGVELPRTGHATLPLMGYGGCTAAPHLRPWCTLHTCQVNGLGFKPNDVPWNEKYERLRTQIDNMERTIGEVAVQQEKTE